MRKWLFKQYIQRVQPFSCFIYCKKSRRNVLKFIYILEKKIPTDVQLTKEFMHFYSMVKQFFPRENKRMEIKKAKKGFFAIETTFYRKYHTKWKEKKIASLNDELKKFFFYIFQMWSNWKDKMVNTQRSFFSMNICVTIYKNRLRIYFFNFLDS